MKKIAYTSFYALFAVFLVWITAAGFGHINGNLLSQLVVTMVVAVGVVAVGIAAYRCKPLHDRCYRVVVPVMFAGMYLLLTLFGVRTNDHSYQQSGGSG